MHSVLYMVGDHAKCESRVSGRLNRNTPKLFWREKSTFIFYLLHCSALDIYKLKKVKNHETIELERSMELSMNSMHNTTINHRSNTTIY